MEPSATVSLPTGATLSTSAVTTAIANGALADGSAIRSTLREIKSAISKALGEDDITKTEEVSALLSQFSSSLMTIITKGGKP